MATFDFSGKTLSESINMVKDAKISQTDKRNTLVKLGIRAAEARDIVASWTAPATSSSRAWTTTFGVEIETINCPRENFISNAAANGIQAVWRGYTHEHTAYYKVVRDSSIEGYNTNEIVTPVLSGSKGFVSLKKCCKALDETGAGVNSSCGLHVHLGAEKLTDTEYCNVFVNYMYLQDAIDGMVAPSRRDGAYNNRWCRRLSYRSNYVLAARTKEQMYDAFRGDRYYAVNAVAYSAHKTIEFRQHQGSTNFTKIEAWVKFLIKLVAWSRDNRLNSNISRIEDIPFLTEAEKAYWQQRNREINRRRA